MDVVKIRKKNLKLSICATFSSFLWLCNRPFRLHLRNIFYSADITCVSFICCAVRDFQSKLSRTEFHMQTLSIHNWMKIWDKSVLINCKLQSFCQKTSTTRTPTHVHQNKSKFNLRLLASRSLRLRLNILSNKLTEEGKHTTQTHLWAQTSENVKHQLLFQL